LETFSYKAVERALAAVHHIPPDALGAFRGRLQHFQRLGIVPASPGRGRKIAYTRADVCLWAFGLEFAEFGIDPRVIKRVLDVDWSKVRRDLMEKAEGQDRVYVFSPSLLGKDFHGSLQQSSARPHGAPYSIASIVVSDLAEIDKLTGSSAIARNFLDRHKSRYGLINLSRLRRHVETALSLAAQESPSRKDNLQRRSLRKSSSKRSQT
jgi:hypothetical protein